MFTPLTVGFLMVLATICLSIIIIVFFGVRNAAQTSLLTHMAALQARSES